MPFGPNIYLNIGYFVVALVVGYFWARFVYTAPKEPGKVPNGSLGWALFVWVVYGLMWPLWAVLVIVTGLYDLGRTHGKGLGRKIGTKLFGKPTA